MIVWLTPRSLKKIYELKIVLNLFKANFDMIQKPFANQFTDFYVVGDAGLKYLTLLFGTGKVFIKTQSCPPINLRN